MSSTTRLLVLGVVRIFQPVHGYDVRRELVSWHVEEWAQLAPGSIYSQLKTLAKEGLVEHAGTIRTLSRTLGPVMSPFESYLTMRGIKTMPLRMERQCANACRLATWLASHPAVERVYFPADPAHPDAVNIRRLLPPPAAPRRDEPAAGG